MYMGLPLSVFLKQRFMKPLFWQCQGHTRRSCHGNSPFLLRRRDLISRVKSRLQASHTFSFPGASLPLTFSLSSLTSFLNLMISLYCNSCTLSLCYSSLSVAVLSSSSSLSSSLSHVLPFSICRLYPTSTSSYGLPLSHSPILPLQRPLVPPHNIMC